MEWLNGPLVWAVGEAHAPMFFFPRECPRVLLWRKPGSTPDDIRRFWRDSAAPMLAFIEERWAGRVAAETLWRYELPADDFEAVDAAIGYFVNRKAVRPVAREPFERLPERLAEAGVELRMLPDLLRLRGAWETSIHFSGLRLRNAQGWEGAP
jgi:hypothetical protein